MSATVRVPGRVVSLLEAAWMRNAVLCALILFVQLGSPAWADSRIRVTRSFVNADLSEVLKIVARDLGRTVYVGPTVQGSVTIDLVDIPAEEALSLILEQQPERYEFSFLEGAATHTIVVTRPQVDICSLPPPGDDLEELPRYEFLLETAPAVAVCEDDFPMRNSGLILWRTASSLEGGRTICWKLRTAGKRRFTSCWGGWPRAEPAAP